MTTPCTSAPQAGTIITRTGVKSLFDAAPGDRPLMGWCQPCGLALISIGGPWLHVSTSAYWSVRQAGHRADWDTWGIDGADLADSLTEARTVARQMSLSDAHGLPWVVELTEAGTRREWARSKAGEERTATGAKLP